MKSHALKAKTQVLHVTHIAMLTHALNAQTQVLHANNIAMLKSHAYQCMKPRMYNTICNQVKPMTLTLEK